MPIPIDHLIHSRRRTIALIVQKDGTLTVRAPLRMADSSIHEFVQGHAAWIQKKQAQAKVTLPIPKKQFSEGETFPYLGREFPLIILPHQRPALTFKEGRFALAIASLPKAHQVFTSWYKVQAMEWFAARVASLADRHHFTYRRVRISSAHTRWGSCTANRTLSFTWRLVMAPPEVIDYVVIHELVHTRVRNHSPKFWGQVNALFPGYKQTIAWLKKNGPLLTLGEE